jgi:signal transduction histidine kinase
VGTLLRSGSLPTHPVDLNETCRRAARLLEHDAHARGVQVSLLLEPTLPTAIGDPVELEQVVLNLALNALDASLSSPSPHIVVRTSAREDEIELAVHDNGPGLAPHVAPHVFDSFFTTKPQGLGLGLVIVRSIVERHHGHVHAENHREGGAVFRVVLSRTRDGCVEVPRTRLGVERPLMPTMATT